MLINKRMQPPILTFIRPNLHFPFVRQRRPVKNPFLEHHHSHRFNGQFTAFHSQELFKHRFGYHRFHPMVIIFGNQKKFLESGISDIFPVFDRANEAGGVKV